MYYGAMTNFDELSLRTLTVDGELVEETPLADSDYNRRFELFGELEATLAEGHVLQLLAGDRVEVEVMNE